MGELREKSQRQTRGLIRLNSDPHVPHNTNSTTNTLDDVAPDVPDDEQRWVTEPLPRRQGGPRERNERVKGCLNPFEESSPTSYRTRKRRIEGATHPTQGENHSEYNGKAYTKLPRQYPKIANLDIDKPQATGAAAGAKRKRSPDPTTPEEPQPTPRTDEMSQEKSKKSKKTQSDLIPVETVANFKWPDPNEPPTEAETNPHNQKSRRHGTPIVTPSNARTTFSDTTYPRITRNVRESKRTARPSQLYRLEPGPDGSKKHPNAHVQLAEFFRSLQVEEETATETQIMVYPPEARIDRSGKPFTATKQIYAKPWSLVLTGASPNLRKSLVWNQIFALNEDMVFSVVEFDDSMRSWVIANIAADPAFGFIRPGREKELLAEVKQKLWPDNWFRQFVDATLGKEGIHGTACDKVVAVTRTLTIEYIRVLKDEDSPTKEYAVAQLWGKPITQDMDDHMVWISQVRRIIKTCRFNALARFEVIRVFKACDACKAETHPLDTCPFLRLQHWYGPSLEKFKAKEKLLLENPKKANENTPKRGGRGGGRGGRGSGRGWRTVGAADNWR
ncbi:hypothetical protein BXZ70DRAFT_910407 [Cristinia sonorae]|uniref:Uncharacterized protein n=1 Tax=Cristinia sonorae TaxID=1940300 RepID=A0A8K0XKZ4_9AGAR|nr:hypothetical protein BXZ70DRAFT_910407 [Cristinia sonorae]